MDTIDIPVTEATPTEAKAEVKHYEIIFDAQGNPQRVEIDAHGNIQEAVEGTPSN